MMQFLQGKYIRLRALEINDLDVLYQWENNPGNWQVSNNLTPYSRFYLEQYILNAQNNIYQDRQLRLMIENAAQEAAGIIDLFDFDPHNRRCAIGILIGEKFRKKGYASEAIDMVIAYCAEVLSLHQLHCTIEHGNPISLRLFLNKGFIITGTRNDWNLRGKTWIGEDFLQLIFANEALPK